MAAQTTKIGIINRGLQLLGQRGISSLNENSIGAKAMLRAYDSIFLAELRKNVWNFSVKRALLAADANPTLFGKDRAYPLPGDYVRVAPEETTLRNPRRRDWQIEGQSIISSDVSPLNLRYVSSNITESMFDVLFAEAVAFALALGTCEEITNSNTKLQNLGIGYKETIGDAKKTNAIENAPVKQPTCSWITTRY